MDQKKLALIHIIKKELKLTDEEYRKILKDAAGVTTAKDLDVRKFRKLMNVFVRSKHYRAHPDAITLKQLLFIKGLCRDVSWSGDHLTNFLSKYYHKPTLDALNKREASKVIESLKRIKDHL